MIIFPYRLVSVCSGVLKQRSCRGCPPHNAPSLPRHRRAPGKNVVSPVFSLCRRQHRGSRGKPPRCEL